MNSKLTRREALAKAGRFLGMSVSASITMGVLAGCEAAPIEKDKGGKVLASDRTAFLASIADHIIPATDTPSASEAGVVGFIDNMLNEYETQEVREAFLTGLAALMGLADRELGGDYAAASPVQQFAWLETFDARAFNSPETDEHHLYRKLKMYVVTGYYVSEPGASEELEYLGVPGPYQGDIPVTEDTRAWAT